MISSQSDTSPDAGRPDAERIDSGVCAGPTSWKNATAV